MHGGMSRRHEGCVSAMLTDKRLEYCTAGAPLQGSGATKWMMQADKHGVSGAFRLDNAAATDIAMDVWRRFGRLVASRLGQAMRLQSLGVQAIQSQNTVTSADHAGAACL